MPNSKYLYYGLAMTPVAFVGSRFHHASPESWQEVSVTFLTAAPGMAEDLDRVRGAVSALSGFKEWFQGKFYDADREYLLRIKCAYDPKVVSAHKKVIKSSLRELGWIILPESRSNYRALWERFELENPALFPTTKQNTG